MRPSFRLGGLPLLSVNTDQTSSAVSPSRSSSSSSSSSGGEGASPLVCELSPEQPTARPPPPQPVEERLLHYGQLYEERRRNAQRRREEEAALAATLLTQPPPPLESRRLFESTPSQHALAEASRRRRAERAAADAAETAARQTGQPAILPASREIAASVRQREQAGARSVAERCAARQRACEQRLEERRREEAAALLFRPTVSAHARELASSVPVVERLYRTAPPSQRGSAVLADVTNRRGAGSSTTAGKPPPSSAAATYERLYHDAVHRRTCSETQTRIRQVQSSGAFTPRINAVSSIIAAQSAEPAHVRLLRARDSVAARHVNPEETFAPRINTAAAAVAGRSAGVPLSTRQQLWRQRRDDRLRSAAAAREEAEMRECTFRPRTNRGPCSGSPWGLGDDAAAQGSAADVMESAEELLAYIDGGGDASSTCSLLSSCVDGDVPDRWGDALRSSMPDDVLTILEEVEWASRHARHAHQPRMLHS